MPTTHMGMTLPTEDGSSGTWDQILNSALGTVVDQHDHSSGKGVSIKTAGISINADLTFGGFAATNLKAAQLAAVTEASVASLSAALFRNTADNELYWRTTGGVNVKLTAGTSLNAALLGGFTGDYGTGDEEVSYSSGTSIYNFLKAANHRAFLDTSDIRLFEATAGVSNAVKLKSPSSLAGSYTLTMPTALPSGDTKLLKVTTGGVAGFTGAATHDGNLTQTGTLTVSGAATLSSTLGVTGALTASAALTVGTTLGVAGAATLSSTLGVAGLITATAGLTCAANQHVVLSGTGKYKRGSLTRNANFVAGGHSASYAVIGLPSLGLQTSTNGVSAYVPIPLEEGETLVSVTLRYNGSNAGAFDFNVYRGYSSGRDECRAAGAMTTSDTGAASIAYVCDQSNSYVAGVLGGSNWYAEVTHNGTDTDEMFFVEYVTTVP